MKSKRFILSLICLLTVGILNAQQTKRKHKPIHPASELIQKIDAEIETTKRTGHNLAMLQGISVYTPAVMDAVIKIYQDKGYTVQTNTNKGRRLVIIISW